MGSKGKKRFKAPRAQGGMSRAQQLEQIQKQVAEAEAALAETTVVATVGGGAVSIEMTGTQEIKSIKISPDVVDPEDVEMLEDLILAAINEAKAKSQEMASQQLGPLAGGLDLPGLF